VPVLITGESGTGKELVARALHRRGDRRDGPFVAVNCAALPEALLESELFGHVKGAFTDAGGPRRGLLPQADGGVLLLDEIGELPLRLQPKLLRALESGSVRPVGSDRDVPVDVRLITATHRDLASEVEAGRFREDLFFRINVVRLEVPPLRSRGSDILHLAQHFLRGISERTGRAVTGIAPAAAEHLLAYPWPGNVRELRNAIERGVALARFDQIAPEDLPDPVRRAGRRPAEPATDDPETLVPLEGVERRHVEKVLGAVGGNKTAAAEVLGLDRTTLHRKLERWARQDP